jgi:hypothetical protein
MTIANQTALPAALACDEILRIAHRDATAAYQDLSGFKISLVHESDGWHVDYDLTDPQLAGGGPHYVIDALSGQILWKQYEQ